MGIKLIVPNIERRIFDAYYYGYGEVVEVSEGSIPARDGGPTFTFVVDYGDDRYRADYQEGRFASGLYLAKVVEEGADG